jgi:hypothetical protein
VFGLILAWSLLTSAALASVTTHTVARTVPADFTDLKTALIAIQALSDDSDRVIKFLDATPATYVLDGTGAEKTLAGPRQWTLTAATAGIVTIDIRNQQLIGATAGGKFNAKNITFVNTTNVANYIIQTWDGCSYDGCTFGPGIDNGILVSSGDNNDTFTNCVFKNITNNGVRVQGMRALFTNCQWQNCGKGMLVDDTWGNSAWGNDTFVHVVGGSAVSSGAGFVQFVVQGFRTVVDDFTVQKFPFAVLADWKDSTTEAGPGEITFNRTHFTSNTCTMYLKQTTPNIKVSNGRDMTTTVTMNSCVVVSDAATESDVLSIDGQSDSGVTRGDNQHLVLNATTVKYGKPRASLPASPEYILAKVWRGGSITARNSAFIGSYKGVYGSSEATGSNAKNVMINLDHCVLYNQKYQSVYVGGAFDKQSVTVTNTIVDASTNYGLDIIASARTLLSNNLLNQNPLIGTNVYTGDPLFVNPAADNFRIQAGSAADNRGVPTTTLTDFDGNAWDATRPDIGLNVLDAEIVINKAGGAGVDYTDFQTFLNDTAGSARPLASYGVLFTDAADVVYSITNSGNGFITRDGLTLDLTAQHAGKVTIDGFLNAARGGGSISATGLNFRNTAATPSNYFLHAYDGAAFTNCSFGPGGDNGVAVRSGYGKNSFTNCNFHDILNRGLEISGVLCPVTNCTWTDVGICLFVNDPWNSIYTRPATDGVIVTGGSATWASDPNFAWSKRFIVAEGWRAIVKNVTVTGYGTGVLCDFQTDAWGRATHVQLEDCAFNSMNSYALLYNQATANTETKDGTPRDMTTTITATRCTFNTDGTQSVSFLTDKDIMVNGNGLGDAGNIILDACTVSYNPTLSTEARVLQVFNGGRIIARNTSVRYGDISVNVSSEQKTATLPYKSILNIDHCVFADAAIAAVTAADYNNTYLTMTNSIVDSSCKWSVADIPYVPPAGTATPLQHLQLVQSHNLYNAPAKNTSDLLGDNALQNQDAKFVDASAGNYHLKLGSAAIGAGVANTTLTDIDGEAYLAAPALGYDEPYFINAVQHWNMFE